MDELTVTASERNGWAVATVAGEIDAYSAPRLREALVEMIDGGARRVLVDLEGVGFMDSTGLASLVAALKHIRSAEGELRVAGLGSNVAKVFEICGLNGVFSVHTNLDEAATF